MREDHKIDYHVDLTPRKMTEMKNEKKYLKYNENPEHFETMDFSSLLSPSTLFLFFFKLKKVSLAAAGS